MIIYTKKNKYLNKKFVFLFYLLLFIFCIPYKSFGQTVLKGSISTVIKKGEVIKINLSTPINFDFSLPGDTIAAFIPKDIILGDTYYIPRGSRIEGILTDIKKPKRLGIDGAFEIDFGKIITPDGNTIPIHATVSSDIASTSQKITKTLTYNSALVSYGAVHGALAGVQLGGIPLVISSDGISVLAGAGIGATFGLIGSFARKGKIPSISNIIPSEVALKNDLVTFGTLPLLEERDIIEKTRQNEFKGFRFNQPPKKEDIQITIDNIKKENDKKYGELIVLELNISNNSTKNLNISDLVLLNSEEINPIHPDIILTGLDALKTLQPGGNLSASLTFTTINNKYDYDLALLDPLDNTEIVRIPLQSNE